MISVKVSVPCPKPKKYQNVQQFCQPQSRVCQRLGKKKIAICPEFYGSFCRIDLFQRFPWGFRFGFSPSLSMVNFFVFFAEFWGLERQTFSPDNLNATCNRPSRFITKKCEKSWCLAQLEFELLILSSNDGKLKPNEHFLYVRCWFWKADSWKKSFLP